MNCPYCGNEIPRESGLIGKWTVHQPNVDGREEGGYINVCGKCYILISMHTILKEIKESLSG